MRRILFIMQLPPPVHGVSIMNSIIRESALINQAFTCEYINLGTASSISDIQKGSFKKVLLAASIFFRALLKLVVRRYDYVYITPFPFGAAFFKDAVMIILARLFRQKRLLHLHTYGFRKHAERSGIARATCRMMFSKADVICLSKRLIEDIPVTTPRKIFILPNGIPQVNFSNDYQPKTPPDILYLSNLIRGKGVLLIIDAAAMLREKGLQFKVRIAGPEADITYAQLERLLKEKKLEGIVTLLGPKYGKEKEAEFRNADIFVLPSDYDTFGLVLLEAIQYGVPCISTMMGGIPDVLGEGRGVLMAEISAKSLAICLEELLNDEEKRKRISRTAFAYFSDNFTVSIFEQRLKSILSGSPDAECRTNHRGQE
jgi:glycosyltransferase involved in cell wall biosynthesis